MGSLIDAAVDILSSNPLPSYMCEVLLFGDLLLCVFSTELYDDNGELLFMDYLQESSKVQVKSAMAEVEGHYMDYAGLLSARALDTLIVVIK